LQEGWARLVEISESERDELETTFTKKVDTNNPESNSLKRHCDPFHLMTSD